MFGIFVLALCFLDQTKLKAEVSIWNRDISKAKDLSFKTKKPLLLDFYAPWCNYCMTLQKVLYPNSAIKSQLDNFILVRINGEEKPEIMRAYNVSAFPTIVFLDYQGLEVDRINGLLEPIVLTNRIKNNLQIVSKTKNILSKLEANPKDLDTLYEVGTYYFQTKNYKIAQIIFYKAWNLHQKEKIESKKFNVARQSLYNAAISSMHLDTYKLAVERWNVYLKKYETPGFINKRENLYAHYYRGISYFYLGNKKMANKDLLIASKLIPDPQLRENAKSILLIK